MRKLGRRLVHAAANKPVNIIMGNVDQIATKTIEKNLDLYKN